MGAMSSDSSEDEDLTRFREAVDGSFPRIILLGQTKENLPIVKQTTKSERYLDEASHYNDVKVPAKLQNQIGAKLSAVIDRNIEFVNVTSKDHKKMKIKGGVKLFKDSSSYLSCDDTEDIYTKLHNSTSRKLVKYSKCKECDSKLSQNDKLNAVIQDGNYILSGVETKLWKSRRKGKIFKYKSVGNSNIAVENG